MNGMRTLPSELVPSHFDAHEFYKSKVQTLSFSIQRAEYIPGFCEIFLSGGSPTLSR